jgi:hypothetical protein
MTTTRVRRSTASGLAACAVLLAAGCGGTPAAGAAPAYAAVLQPELEAFAKDMLTTGAVVMVRSPEQGDWAMTYGTRT